MYKPNSLRQHLSHANPDLKQNPDKLLIFADMGHIVAVGTGSLSFEYQYKLNIIIIDYAGSEDAIMVPLLAWVSIHQIELLSHHEKRQTGIQFEVDFNNHETIDLSIKLDLTERVIVKKEHEGKLQVTHRPEPQPMLDYADRHWSLHNEDNFIAEWFIPSPHEK